MCLCICRNSTACWVTAGVKWGSLVMRVQELRSVAVAVTVSKAVRAVNRYDWTAVIVVTSMAVIIAMMQRGQHPLAWIG